MAMRAGWIVAVAIWTSACAFARADANAAQPVAPGPRFALCDDFCALVDRHGTLVVPRVFESIHSFDAPVAVYEHRGKKGAIDASGRTIVPPVHASLMTVDDDRFIMASDTSKDGVPVSTLYDATGRRVLRERGENAGVGAALGHAYAHRCAPGASGACSWTFVDDEGRARARFVWMDDSQPNVLFPASVDGRRYGYINAQLQFVVPPQFNSARAFSGRYATFSTAQGVGLIDDTGHIVIQPGRYSDIYADRDALLILAFAPGDRQCGAYVRHDGSQVQLPDGVCPDVMSDSTVRMGYAFVRGPKGKGTIDARGKPLIPPVYASLKAIDSSALAFSDQPGKDAPVGVLDRHGNVVLPARYTHVEAGPQDTFVAASAAGTGLIDRTGKWRVPPRFGGGRKLSAQLVGFSIDKPYGNGSGYVVYRADGTRVPVESRYPPQQIPEAGKAQAFRIYGDSNAQGVMGGDGQLRVPMQAHTQEIRYLGDGIWEARVQALGGREQRRFYDAQGQSLPGLARMADVSRFQDGVATARDADDHAVLVDRHGAVLASFAALFPQYVRHGDPVVEQSLDRCFVADPAAEPGEQGSAAARSAVDRRICASASLSALSRATEQRYFGAQAGDCLPSDFAALRPAYDKALASCGDDACMAQAMRAFQHAIDGVRHQCEARPPLVSFLKTPVPREVRQRLYQQVLRSGAEDLGDSEGNAAGPDALSYTSLALAGRHAVLAVAPTTAHNGPFWLFLAGPQGRWRLVLNDYAGYLRPFEGTDGKRGGLPILRTQQHASCCEHEVHYYAFDGARYRTLLECTQLYDGDVPVLFCGDESRDETVRKP